MSDIDTIKNALVGDQNQTGTVVKVTSTTMEVSTAKGIVTTTPQAGVIKGQRVTIKQGIITPLNTHKAATFYL